MKPYLFVDFWALDSQNISFSVYRSSGLRSSDEIDTGNNNGAANRKNDPVLFPFRLSRGQHRYEAESPGIAFPKTL
jgi:hypothetical protein